MEGFAGFPEGKLESTSLPDLFFSELLPIIDDLFELKVTLHCLWLIQQKQGEMRHITSAELLADQILMRGLQDVDLSAEDALKEGLERAVARGTLLEITVLQPGHPDARWYFVNGERGRAAVARIERGEWAPEGDDEPVRLQARRPNIFNLYEQNFGLIQSPILAEELKDAEQTYPQDWIKDAFYIAVSNNVRRWAYVRSILERWTHEGRGPRHGADSKEERRRYVEGEYADHIKH
jgi:DNA replication protein